MEEEVGIKAIRLRRRLSVEAEDVKSPSTQSTPTMKRGGGRLAAKPQLQLIAENVPELIPNKTTKAVAAEEKVLTPSRRSTRIRSNTSILSETPEVEEKSTPARRTTRVKSTSIVAEVTSVTTPRAKRAARRNSQVGSDNDAPVTPVRQTRRTRKDSTSSVDKTGDKTSQIKEVIVEETENSDQGKNETSPKQESPVRKSPRLTEKALSKISSSQLVVQIEKLDITSNIDKLKVGGTDEPTPKAVKEETPSKKNNISVTSANLIKELDDAPKKDKTDMNKSTNALYDEPIPKTRRNRTKSWTTISLEPTDKNDNNFCSDSEVVKMDNKKKNNPLNTSNISGSGDGIMNTRKKEKSYENSLLLSDKKNKKRQEKSMLMDTETSEHNASTVIASPKPKKTTEEKSEETSALDDKEVVSLNTSKQIDSSGTEKLFNEAPTGLIQSLVYIDDSDSNHGSMGKGNTEKAFDSEDQCVPVVVHDVGANETIKESANSLSYEPMDVDETLPENISQSTFAQKNNSIKLDDKGNESQKRKSLNVSPMKNDSLLNSRRKSSVSNVVSEDTLDGSPNLSSRKSLDKSTVNDDSFTKKTNRMSTSIFNVSTVDNIEGDVNKSKRNSLTTDNVKDESMNEKSDKSKRNSQSPIVSKDKNSSATSALVLDENMDKSLNKSKRRSSVSAAVSEAMDKTKSSNSDSVIDEDIINKSSNKSKGKTSILNEVNDTVNKSPNNSKRKSSIVPETESHDKTDNENKSTLVLSQIKDLSQSEFNVDSNVPKDESNLQLSKSLTGQNVTLGKETDKKNLSLTYLTSTPLQQKSLKKLGMQINSSIITPSSANKKEKKNTTKNSTKEDSIMSQEDSSEEDDESEEESSLDKSNMIDDEAEEAGTDYESGDSRDDEEKEYEEQNEVLEKGETLDSDEEDISDEEYEKDSFIVSSDEEDNDLLSGSGDDLDMSDNELSMSKKSKMKYNERKSKEQKKASKEMFEARHQTKSDKTGKSTSKKNNRQRLDSTTSESENEEVAPPKNRRRQRIDSSQDISNVQSDADKSLSKKNISRRMSVSICEDNKKDKTICEDSSQRIDPSQDTSNVQSNADKTLSSKKKKIARRMSVCICEDKETDEKEVTILQDLETDKADPLSLQNVIKVEPKTPQKDLNISTVAVTSVDEMEELIVDRNATILESNQTSDPIQTTQNDDIGEDDENEDSISENEEITENYESVLDNLNKVTSKKNKSQDISLNLDKKTKQKKPKEPIVDQLNLTQVKKSKKKQSAAEEDPPKKEEKGKDTEKDLQVFSEASSDSIELKLLFPEDSTDSDVLMVTKGTKNEQPKENIQKEENIEIADDYIIPLKRTEGKTNMLENTETVNKSIDESVLNVSSKKKNKRKSAQVVESEDLNDHETSLNFFIDTTGNLTESHKADANTSVKNSAKKNKQNNVSILNIEEDITRADSIMADANTSVKSSAKKNKQKNNVSILNIEEDITRADSIMADANTSVKSSAKKNKQKNNVSILNIEEDITRADSIMADANTSVKSSAKKNKQKNNVSFADIDEDKLKFGNDLDNEAPLEVAYQSNKNKAQLEEENTAAETINQSAKKKKKNKKGLNNSQTEEVNLFGKTDHVAEKSNTSISISDGSAKKKKKLSESQVEQEIEKETVLNISIGSSKKQKKRTVSESCELVKETEGDKDVNTEDNSKKRKRKASATQTEILIKDDLNLDTSKTLNDATVNQKKKRKISPNNDETEKSDIQEIVKESQEKAEVKNSRKKNKFVQDQAVNENYDDATKKNKKRKERDDDDPSKISKVLKQNSFDKVHVPRLPANVLEQLSEKPKTDTLDTKKPNAISTTSFIVEQTKKRKTKPSNYLEESVYLNDSVEERKQKGSVKNPKVLPFIPTASTSDYGFTTNFRVNVIPQHTQFVAQSSGISNFKNDYLSKKRIKKLGTLEKFKRQRSVKLSKF